MSDCAPELDPAEKALLKTNQVFTNKINKSLGAGGKSYSDKNGNDVSKAVAKGRKTFLFWMLICLLFVLAVGNLMLTFTILTVLRLGRGMESLEFLPEHNAMKFMGRIELEHVHKRDGLIEGFRDEPMALRSEGGAVVVSLTTRASRADTKLVANASGLFFGGVSSVRLVAPSGDTLFTTDQANINVEESISNLHAKQISTKRITSPIDEDLVLRSDTSAHLLGAEGTRMESKELFWSADQDIYLRSINGSVVLSGKEGVFIDVRYLPIALPANKTEKIGQTTGQFKVCVCMPQGKLFRIAVPNGQKISCSHINLSGEMSPCL